MITLAEYKLSPYYKTDQSDDHIEWLIPEVWGVLKNYTGKSDIDLVPAINSAACKLINFNFSAQVDGLKSESLGDYSVTFAEFDSYPTALFMGISKGQSIK